HPETLVARKRIKNPYDIELPVALRVVDSRHVDAVVELLLVTQNLQDRRNQRAIDLQVVLVEIGPGLKARSVLPLQLIHKGRIPRLGNRTRRLGGGSGFRGSGCDRRLLRRRSRGLLRGWSC